MQSVSRNIGVNNIIFSNMILHQNLFLLDNIAKYFISTIGRITNHMYILFKQGFKGYSQEISQKIRKLNQESIFKIKENTLIVEE